MNTRRLLLAPCPTNAHLGIQLENERPHSEWACQNIYECIADLNGKNEREHQKINRIIYAVYRGEHPQYDRDNALTAMYIHCTYTLHRDFGRRQ